MLTLIAGAVRSEGEMALNAGPLITADGSQVRRDRHGRYSSIPKSDAYMQESWWKNTLKHQTLTQDHGRFVVWERREKRSKKESIGRHDKTQISFVTQYTLYSVDFV